MRPNYLFLTITVLVGSLLAGSTKTQAQVNLKSISVGASYWKPSLDYWNNNSMLLDYNLGTGAKLSGAIMPTAAIEIGLTKGLSIGGRVGIWKDEVSGPVKIGDVTRTEKLSLSIIPVSLDVKYTFEKAAAGTETKAPFLTPYVGLSVSRYFISNDFSRTSTSGSLSESQSGNSYGIQALVGAEKKLVKKLYLALDVRYHMGSYNQIVKEKTTDAGTKESVSLNGLEAGLSLKVKFK
ncbi:hypothetical protein [Spirosoma pulveris]